MVKGRMEIKKSKNLRSSIRYPIQFSIDLVLDSSTTVAVETINISRCGLQFCCDSWVANKIEPRGIHNHSLDHIQLEIFADLTMEQVNKLHTQADVVYAQRISHEEYIIGIEFTDLEGSNKKILEQLIEMQQKTG